MLVCKTEKKKKKKPPVFFFLALRIWPMRLKIFRRQGDEYFVSDIVVGFAEEET